MIKKTVIVTGASRGIGRETAKLFAFNGYHVIINYNNSYEEAKDLLKELKKNEYPAEIFKADVRNREEVNEMVKYTLEKYENIDALINNAGIAQTKLFTEISSEEWDKMFDVNMKGMFNCTQECLKTMLKNKKGKIINISSIWGITGGSAEVHYSASKAGVIGFTKALAKELGPSNIQVNCIAPGVIQTDMISEYNQDEIQEIVENTPLMKLGQPRDIAECALFLASEKSNFITGQVISPNGGMVI